MDDHRTQCRLRLLMISSDVLSPIKTLPTAVGEIDFVVVHNYAILTTSNNLVK